MLFDEVQYRTFCESVSKWTILKKIVYATLILVPKVVISNDDRYMKRQLYNTIEWQLSTVFNTLEPFTKPWMHQFHPPNAPVPSATVHHFVTEKWTCEYISVTMWCIMECLSSALWDLWDGFIIFAKQYWYDVLYYSRYMISMITVLIINLFHDNYDITFRICMISTYALRPFE